jgi:hypothetical protein
MLSSTSVRALRAAIPSGRRLLHSTVTRSGSSPAGQDPQLSQGNVNRSDQNRSPQDVQSQAAESGFKAKQNRSSDAAIGSVKGASRSGSGNPEGVGMKDQVGSASTSDRGDATGTKVGEEAASAPGYIGKAKQALGIEKDRDVKRDDRRAYHTSAVLRAGVRRADPATSRVPHDDTVGTQNEHLRYKKGDKPDTGKGNAGAEPALPSQKTPQVRSNAPRRPPKGPTSSSRAAFHTSTLAATPIGNPAADPERQPLGRDVETNPGQEKSTLAKTADSQGQKEAVTLKEREREIEQGQKKRGSTSGGPSDKRKLHTSSASRAGSQPKPSADSYFKDIDEGPSSQPGVHKVDSSSDAFGESGSYRQAGVGDKDYQTVAKKAPYVVILHFYYCLILMRKSKATTSHPVTKARRSHVMETSTSGIRTKVVSRAAQRTVPLRATRVAVSLSRCKPGSPPDPCHTEKTRERLLYICTLQKPAAIYFSE